MMLRFFWLALLLVSCSPEKEDGEVVALELDRSEITDSDIEHRMSQGTTREQAIEQLEKQQREVRAAMKAGLAEDPVVRARVAGFLTQRHRELVLKPQIKEAIASVTEERLKDLYEKNIDRFKQPARRQVAVLWLDPGADPARKTAYLEKMKKAREWFLGNDELLKKPEAGFSALSIDHSQHAASRYRGGVIGWVQQAGGTDQWSRALAEIAFKTERLSEVIDHSEGIFLVRVMKSESVRTREFNSVKSILRKEEVARLRKEAEEDFEQSLKAQ